MPDVGIVLLPRTEATGEFGLPQVVSAVATDENTVRITYDQKMKRVSPSNPDDALNPSNYSFVGTSAITPASVASVSNKIYDVTLNEEMTNSAAYTAYVSNVKSEQDELIHPTYNNASFTGIGTRPEVSSATAPSVNTVRVTFNEAMLNNAALINPSNYTFTGGPPSLTATNVAVIDSTHVDVTINEMLDGLSYTIQVDNVFDAASNPIASAPDNQAVFTGTGQGPTIVDVTAASSTTVEVEFSETVDAGLAGDDTNYVIEEVTSGDPLAVSFSVQQNPSTYLLTTASQDVLMLYRITISNIKDAAGNLLDPHPAIDTFLGTGDTPPDIDIYPDNNETDVPIRHYVRVTVADQEEIFSGVQQATIGITATNRTTNVTADAVVAGQITPSFEGYTRGDPATREGITFYFRPVEKWQPETGYRIFAEGKDLDNSQNDATSDFATGVAICFEDDLPQMTYLEQKIATGIGLTNVDKIRDIFLRNCTSSSLQIVRARTLLWYATSTDLKGVFEEIYDFTLSDVQVCDRARIPNLHEVLPRYYFAAMQAIDEIPLLDEKVKVILRSRLDNNAPLYVVNVYAAIVLLGAILAELAHDAV